jgi:hypothetical protein
VVLLILLFVAAAAASAEPAAPLRVCGDDHDYTFQPPPGWKLAADDSEVRAVRTFTPKGGTLDADGTMLSLARAYQEVGVDFDEGFELGVAAFVVQQLPTSIAEPELRHPTLASHAVRFDYPNKQIVTVMMDSRNGNGLLVGLTLTHVGDKLPPELLAQFEASLASLRFDAGRVCKRGPDGAVHEETVAATAPPPASPKAPAPTPQQLALRKATAVCTWLERSEMPVRCERGLLRGKPVTLARFDDYEGRTAQQLMDAFHPPIARVYCWVAAERMLPLLAFYAPGSKTSDAAVPWSCKEGKFGDPVPYQEFRAE